MKLTLNQTYAIQEAQADIKVMIDAISRVKTKLESNGLMKHGVTCDFLMRAKSDLEAVLSLINIK